jgi:CubicO group peptidase (beta-lactamase class C family)
VFLCSCNVFSDNKKPGNDTIQLTHAVPEKLDPKEFDYYSNILNAFFENHLINKGFNGDILIAKKGNIVYEKYIGYADLRKKDSLTDSTPLHIASAGKTFTGIAILQMVQEKKIVVE